MTEQQAIEALHALPRLPRSGASLERMQALLDHLGNPEKYRGCHNNCRGNQQCKNHTAHHFPLLPPFGTPLHSLPGITRSTGAFPGTVRRCLWSLGTVLPCHIPLLSGCRYFRAACKIC